MLHLGKKPAEVAELLLVTETTIYNWHARWREGGIDELADKPKSGRPKKATDAYRARLDDTTAAGAYGSGDGNRDE